MLKVVLTIFMLLSAQDKRILGLIIASGGYTVAWQYYGRNKEPETNHCP